MDLILAFSLQDQVEKYGAYVGLAAFLGLAVLSLLYFAQARELKRLRDWAGRAPERALELEARVVAQAEEALREAESGQAAPAAAASGNGGQVAAPAAVPMGPRPAVAVAAAAARAQAGQATVEAPVVPASTDGDEPPADDQETVVPVEAEGDERADAPAEDESEAVATGDAAAPPADPAVVPTGEEAASESPDDDRATVPEDEEPSDDQAAEPPGEAASDEEPAIAPVGWANAAAAPAEDEDRESEAEPERSGNGVPAAAPAQIPRATPRPQPRPAAAAPLRASTPSRPVTVPPRRSAARRTREDGSRAGLYTVLGILVLAAAIFVPVYFMVLADGDEPAPPPNPIAEPGGDQATSGAGTQASEARPEKVVVVLNGTPVDGLASGERDKLIAAGYSDEQGMIRIDNNQDQQCQDSIVLYAADERRQARDVSRLLDITRTEQIDEETQALADSSDQSGTLPADVVALLCADKSP
jgi:LytR cell envelope-related transcriptional attenuator